MDFKYVDLSVAAERSMRLIVRMTTAGVMSRAGLTMDEMEDMKMAIDEACNLMVLQKPKCQTLKFRYGYNESSVNVRISGEDALLDADGEMHSDENMQEVILCILRSMADEVVLQPREDGSVQAIFLEKKIPEGRRPAI